MKSSPASYSEGLGLESRLGIGYADRSFTWIFSVPPANDGMVFETGQGRSLS
jgi:hypothetical protein